MNLFPIFQYGLVGTFVVLLGTFLLVMLSESVEGYASPLFGLDAKNDTLTFLGIGLGGVLLALQALMSYRRAKALEDTANTQAAAAKAQADATREQAKANHNTEQGQRQERLKNAIEHLGHASDSVRLGGAYELFHLADDTEELQQRQPMLDILCVHLRQTTGKDEYRKKHPSKPSEEIQSLLTFLFVQEHEVFKGLRINLQGSHLNGADLTQARLEKADLTGAYLRGANFSWAWMQEAVLAKAHLQSPDFREARLQLARLDWTKMQGTNLHGTWMQGASLVQAELQGAYLSGARLQLANLGSARLQAASLDQVQFQEASLDGATWSATDSNASSFEDRMRRGIWRVNLYRRLQDDPYQRDPYEAIFAGGLKQEDLDSLVEGLPDERVKEFRGKLKPHVGKPASHELPGGFTGAYTAQEAEQWIAEYDEAMSEAGSVAP
ncbi:MAG: pentapeptide repeat-containing protein [Desulfurellaceae bacterium]|nr:pentapeptide repeat-containing protein [Desulfurellaceae bacterium]